MHITKLKEKYGDSIILGINPKALLPDASENMQREAAAKFEDKFCQPGKPITIGISAMMMGVFFREELNKLSRIKYSVETAKSTI
ncbi:MAG: hypothetical protein ACOWWH_06120 [Eubacteriaceae bacterium]